MSRPLAEDGARPSPRASRPATLGVALAARTRRLLRAEPISMVVCALIVCAFYFWTAYTTVGGTQHYGLLTDAFLDGQTNLPIEASDGLLALEDPYDPAQNAPYRALHDVSFYEGRFYLYFGPTPAALVHLPLRAVGVEASDALATSLLASAGFLFALALMRFLVDRYRPQTSLVTRTVAALLLGLANVAPFVLRRPAVWEVAITAGYCCLLAALYLTLTGALRARPSLIRLTGGSLALGLAAGARPHLLLSLPVFVWAWYAAWRSWRSQTSDRRSSLSLLAVIMAPLTVCIALLGIYNVARFGSLTEFGQSYQLSGIRTGAIDRFDLDRLGPGLFSYLLAPPRFGLAFPFAHADATYTGVALSPEYLARMEPVAGALATTPVLLLALLAPWLRVRAEARARESMSLACLLLVSGVVVFAVPLFSFDGATMRYEMDWVTILLLSALLVWLRAQELMSHRPFVRGATTALVGVSCLMSVGLALAFSVTGYVDGLRLTHPETYARLVNSFGFVPTLASHVQGKPVILVVGSQRLAAADGVVLADPTTGMATSETSVQLAAPGAGSVDLNATFDANPALPRGSIVVLNVLGSDGKARRFPLVTRNTTVRAGLRGSGLQVVQIRWETVRYGRGAIRDPGVQPGFAVDDMRVVRWAPQ